jgi:hypothetical protein
MLHSTVAQSFRHWLRAGLLAGTAMLAIPAFAQSSLDNTLEMIEARDKESAAEAALNASLEAQATMGRPAAQAAPAALPKPTLEPLPPSMSGTLYKLLGNEIYKSQMGSVFFTPQQLSLLDQVYRMIAEGRQEEAIAMLNTAQPDPMDVLMGKADEQPGPTDQKKVEIPPDIPMFYLSSIMYVSPDEWALWLNGKRFTARRPATGDGKVEVIAVSPTEASFTWMPYRYQQIATMITADLQNQKAKDREQLADAGMEIITPKAAVNIPQRPNSVATLGRIGVDEATRKIYFTLRTNQSFYTLPPRIGEGLPFRNSQGNDSLPTTTRLAPAGQPPLVQQLNSPMEPMEPVAPLQPAAPAAEPQPTPAPVNTGPASPGDNYREVDGLIQRM